MSKNNLYYTIDRIVGDTAVCLDDDNNKLEIPIEILYHNAKESDVFIDTKNGYCLDEEETKKRKQHNLNLFKKIMRKGDTD